jgi:hypothetical protein
MRGWNVLLVLAAAWGPAAAQPLVKVRLYDHAGMADKALEGATAVSRRLLLDAGVPVEWIMYTVRGGQVHRWDRAAVESVNAADILLWIVPRTMERDLRPKKSVLGYAVLGVERPANRAYVLYDRVRGIVRDFQGISESRLLGYVMAHEIAHLLLGDERHSPRGMMMSWWREPELAQVERGTLRFSPWESAALRTGALSRAKPF